VLATIGDAVPPGVELGYHLCYGSPADEHLVQPGHWHHGRDDQRHRCRRQTADSVFPHARAQGAHGRRLLPAARGLQLRPRRRSISASSITMTPQAMRRVCRRQAARARGRHRHRMRHGARAIPLGSPRCWRRMSG
jgi:hypothetical protein